MKNLFASIIALIMVITSCSKDDNNEFDIDNSINAKVEIQNKDVSHLNHAIFTTLDNGKLVVFFSQFDIKKYYDAKVNSMGKKSDFKIPNQIFYIGIYPATEGTFPDLAKRQMGAINYTKLILDTDFKISLSASQAYTATHVVIDPTKMPIELGKYNINISEYKAQQSITGDFSGTMIKIDMETKQPDTSATPLSVNGSFESAGYVDYKIIKEMIPIDISSFLK